MVVRVVVEILRMSTISYTNYVWPDGVVVEVIGLIKLTRTHTRARTHTHAHTRTHTHV